MSQDSPIERNVGESPLRIVHVLRAPVGGLFRHVMDLARAQIARGHEVGLITDSLTGGARGAAQLAEIAPSLSLGLMRLPIRRQPHPNDIVALLKVGRRLAELKPDVVHGHGSKGGLLARLAGPLTPPLDAARAYTPHGGSLNYHPGSWSHRLFMVMEGLLARRTDLLLFESGYIGGRFESFVGEPRCLALVVRNGIAPKELEPVTPRPGAADLLYVGEFRAAKGLDTLLDALALLAEAGRRPSLVLVGDGPDKESMRARAETLGVASQVSMRAPMAARDAFTEGRILAIPSRAESLPYILLEAAGAHMPTIATRVGGVPEIFGPYADRLIACDDPEALRDALVRMLDASPQETAEKSRELAEYVGARFSLSDMVDGVVAGYREALGRRPDRARRHAAFEAVKARDLVG